MAYKHVIRAKTKNLFKTSNTVGTLTGGFGPNVARNFEEDKWYIGFTTNNYYNPNNIIAYSFKDNLIYYNGNGAGYGLSRAFKCEPNSSYYISCLTIRISGSGLGYIYAGFYDESGNYISNNNIEINHRSFTTPANCKWLIINLSAKGFAEVYFKDIQLELGSTPTPYTPYNYLQSNKRMIKVSDVCQLFDKDNLNSFVVGNLDKITVTDNKDGTFIINGSYSNTYNSWYILNEWNVEKGNISQIVEGHKYLLLGDVEKVSGDIHLGIVISYVDGSSQSNYAGIITSLKTTKLKVVRVQYSLHKGDTADNAISKPQLFDLTEMFGAGHEPATVAEFRQRFPNEYYPYSPQCWLTSYKSAVVCKTKNLFDVNNAVVINYNSQQETIDATHYVKDGIVYSDWNNHWIGTCVGIKGGWVLPAGTYTMSVKIAYNTKRNDEDGYRGGQVGFVCILADGSKTRYMQWHAYIIPGERYAYTAEILAGCKNIMLYLSASANPDIYSLPAAYCELMIEQGSTATSYVPYQHL